MQYQIENKSRILFSRNIDHLSPIPHIHTHLEIVYVTEGISNASVDNKVYLLQPGDMLIVFPHQIHFYDDQTALVKHKLFVFPIDTYPELVDVFRKKIPENALVKANFLSEDINVDMEKVINFNKSSNRYEQLVAKGYLLSIVGQALSKMTLMPCPTNSDIVKELMIFCSTHYTEPLTLDYVAEELHVSKYYISHIFQKRFHIGFNYFINILRVEHACKLLEKGCGMTEIAFASGFSTIRTFNRVFIKHMGISPSDYQKSEAKSKLKAY